MCKTHSHDHFHEHLHSHSGQQMREVELEENVMKANDELAEHNRSMLERHGINAFDFMGAIGSGKTTLIGKITEKLSDDNRVAILNGDATTVDDFDESVMRKTQLLQISTKGECHLDANMVARALQKVDLHHVDLMFIENVGNLLCPAEFPLGSKSRVVVVSVSEGPYTVKKHPYMFMGAEVVVINKMDLAEIMEVDVDQLVEDVRTVNPNAKVITTSCRTGEGVDEFLGLLLLTAGEKVNA